MLLAAHFVDFDPYEPLLGSRCHGFQTMGELVNSLTLAYEERRWLDAEEQTAMMLNPARFMWAGGPINDQLMYRDCYFFVISLGDYQEELVENSEVDDNRWDGYAPADKLPRQENFVGTKKYLPNNRRFLDTENISLGRMEVRGVLRARRRCLLPTDFVERAGFAPPFPDLMVIQYQGSTSSKGPASGDRS